MSWSQSRSAQRYNLVSCFGLHEAKSRSHRLLALWLLAVQYLPDNALVTINRTRQIGNADMFLIRVCQQYASGAVQISLVGTLEVRDISTIVDNDLLKA